MNARWTPGIGDPGVLGWGTVVAYLMTAVACVAVARRTRSAPRLVRGFWMALAAVLLALGINKQLDLQSWFTQAARGSARLHGWYDERRTLQAAFIITVMAGAFVMSLVLWRLWPVLRRNMHQAATGLVFVVTYVLLRAASFHHVDVFINRTLLGVRWNAILELGGTGLMLRAAVREWRSQASPRA